MHNKVLVEQKEKAFQQVKDQKLEQVHRMRNLYKSDTISSLPDIVAQSKPR